MNKAIGWSVLTLAALGVGVYFYLQREPVKAPEPPDELTVPKEEMEAIEHPIPADAAVDDPAAKKPLPALEESDARMQEELTAVAPADDLLMKSLVTDKMIRRIVASVDGLARKKLAVQMRPMQPLPGTLVTEGDADNDEVVTLGAGNYARYTPFVKSVQALDANRVATVYFRLYPLFQQAYEDLGFPGRYFNDRLVAVIDHLLDTPQVDGPIELVRPKVFFEYKDPELEALSSGQKLLVRMGGENATIVKGKLRELRQAVSSGGAR
jgi:hypothetical protein